MNNNESVFAFAAVVFALAFLWSFVVGVQNEHRAVKHACGECDHVGECGDYECRPGVDGWQLKAGAR